MKSMVSRPGFWIAAIVVIFVLYKAPHDASDILRAAGDAIVTLIRGIGTFLEKLGSA
jgi:hypothetical protein